MTRCRRIGLVALLVGIGLLVVAALVAHGVIPDGPGRVFRLAVLGGIAVLMWIYTWFWPGEMHDGTTQAHARRYYREFAPPMAAYVVVMMSWTRLLASVDATWLRVLIALLPAVLVALVIRAVARYVRDADEMQRRLELESIAIAAGLVGGVYMSLGFLQSAKLIALGAEAAMLWVFPLLCMLYGLVKLVIVRRYA
mgnify:CR=1 FL=1